MSAIIETEKTNLSGYIEGNKSIQRVITTMSKLGATPQAMLARITGIAVWKERNDNIAALCEAFGRDSTGGYIISISTKLKKGLGINEDQASFLVGKTVKLARDAMSKAELCAIQAIDAAIHEECAYCIANRGAMEWVEVKERIAALIGAEIAHYAPKFARWRNV